MFGKLPDLGWQLMRQDTELLAGEYLFRSPLLSALQLGAFLVLWFWLTRGGATLVDELESACARAAARARVIVPLMALGATAVSAWLAWDVLGGRPHIQDEIAYLFTARTFAAGHVVVAPPPEGCGPAFDTAFVVRESDRWYGKYPPGWPLVLALGVLARAPWLVNPILTGIAVLLFHPLARRFLPAFEALLATALLAGSPFFLVMGASLMSHALVLVLLLVALHAAAAVALGPDRSGSEGAASGTDLDQRPVASRGEVVGSPQAPESPPAPMATAPGSAAGATAEATAGAESGAAAGAESCATAPAPDAAAHATPWGSACWCAAGACVAWMAATRPLDMLCLAPPPLAAMLWAAWRRGEHLAPRLAALAWPVLLVLVAHLWYDFALTGNPWLHPFLRHNPIDRPGFGVAVGTFGAEGHNVFKAVANLTMNGLALGEDLFGWPFLSLLPAALGLLLPETWNWLERVMIGQALLIVLGYFTFMGHGVAYGARYYHALIPVLVLLSVRALLEISVRLGRAARAATLLSMALGLVLALATWWPARVYHLTDYWEILSRPDLCVPPGNGPRLIVIPAGQTGGIRDLFDSFVSLDPVPLPATLGPSDTLFVRDGPWVADGRLTRAFPGAHLERLDAGLIREALGRRR